MINMYTITSRNILGVVEKCNIHIARLSSVGHKGSNNAFAAFHSCGVIQSPKDQKQENTPKGGIENFDIFSEKNLSPSSGRRRKNVVEGYSDAGELYLLDGITGESEEVAMKGSCIVLPHSYFSWNAIDIHSVAPIMKDDGSRTDLPFKGLLNVIEPPIETIIFGTDPENPMDHLLFRDMQKSFRKEHGVLIEQMSKGNACATFNVLNAEDRRVMLAIIG